MEGLVSSIIVPKSEESAAEAESQGKGRLRFKKERRVIELELFQRVTQVRILGAVGRIEAAVYHGLRFFVARQRLGAGARVLRNCIADAGVLDILDGGGEIAHLSRRQLIAGDELTGSEITDFYDLRRRAGRHHAYRHSLADQAIADAAEYDDTAIGIIERIEDQGFEGSLRISFRSRNLGDNSFQHIFDADALLCRDQGRVFRLNADDVLYLLLDLLRHGAGQVDLVDHGEDVQIMFQSQINIGESLRLDTLCGVHHQDRAVTGRQRAAHFIVEIHMAGRIDQIKDVFHPIFCFIDKAYRLALDRDPALALQFHIVQDLILHLTAGEKTGPLDHAVRQRRFAVIYVGHDAEVSGPLPYTVVMICCHIGNVFLSSTDCRRQSAAQGNQLFSLM